ncbi:hypothetical protein LCGC14_2598880 [marine sediment metagenome]|uniref:Lipoprotein n=1 Tax=marine sediment metagenome TaxID=412755 RepID=A0A0F9AX46_9ZZZZ
MGIKICSILLFFCIIVAGCSGVRNEQRTLELKQLAINKDNSISGTFFLGSGYINQDNDIYYYFYTKNENGVIRLRKAIYHRIKIIEDNNTKPYVIVQIKCDSNECWVPSYAEWEFHIPENSIIENYNVNLN